MTQEPEAQIVCDLAAEALAAQPLEAVADALFSVAVHTGGEPARAVLDLEAALERPRRQRGTLTFHDVGSLAAYVVLHNAKDGTTTAWADWRKSLVTAVLNGAAGAGKPTGWGDHRAVLTARTTPEWERWVGGQGKKPQAEFAHLIEQGAAEITRPAAATMLEIATRFEATVRAEFKEATNLANGVKSFEWTETVEARAGTKVAVEVPRSFEVTLAPYEEGPAYPLEALLVYVVRDGRLLIGYELRRAEEAKREAFKELLVALEATTGLKAFHGDPPSPVPPAGYRVG